MSHSILHSLVKNMYASSSVRSINVTHVCNSQCLIAWWNILRCVAVKLSDIWYGITASGHFLSGNDVTARLRRRSRFLISVRNASCPSVTLRLILWSVACKRSFWTSSVDRPNMRATSSSLKAWSPQNKDASVHGSAIPSTLPSYLVTSVATLDY